MLWAQGKYREYAAILFKNQKDLSATKLREYAAQAGLDVKKFNLALQSQEVNRDLKEGLQLGINSTPSIFINGRRVEDRSTENMKHQIESILKKNNQ
jgi:protein-disulfide isomerase